MPHLKKKKIADSYGMSFDTLIKKWYLVDMLSGAAISEKIDKEVSISITSRAIHNQLKKIGISRDKSTARVVGIRIGRVDYGHLRKSIKSAERRKGISLGTRYSVFKRDNFRCKICGVGTLESRLVIDHIIPIVNGGTNSKENLRAVCSACNHGKMIYEREK
ncbi:MAG: HNH endonuclease signature motif containing protein [Candidatus Uhrbacteria bacterium]|nr:HNH endonuclease signature motif containing protein [Candidatus Uhrbacteria bacterium]